CACTHSNTKCNCSNDHNDTDHSPPSESASLPPCNEISDDSRDQSTEEGSDYIRAKRPQPPAPLFTLFFLVLLPPFQFLYLSLQQRNLPLVFTSHIRQVPHVLLVFETESGEVLPRCLLLRGQECRRALQILHLVAECHVRPPPRLCRAFSATS